MRNVHNRGVPVTTGHLTAACATVSFSVEMSFADSPVTLSNSTSDMLNMLP